MPQMAPLSWMMLFTVFSILVLFVSVKSYFYKNNMMEINPMKKKLSNMNSLPWKW